LILATDGAFDNLFQEEILEIVRNFSKSNSKTKESALLLSKMIAEEAHQKSKKNNIKTPFNVKKAKALLQFRNKLNNSNAKTKAIQFKDTALKNLLFCKRS